tara:strand:- start:43 stop:537 length:495 start_codon:yes stop_codon:yes gene_type:complete
MSAPVIGKLGSKMEFETWESPFEEGTAWIIDVSWSIDKWSLTKSSGAKVEILGNPKHKDIDLIARVFHEETEALYELAFETVNAYRLLDEHGLLYLWSSERPKKNTFKLKGHPWHKESPLSFAMGNNQEWSHMLVTNDECLEVICSESPKITKVENVRFSGNAT